MKKIHDIIEAGETDLANWLLLMKEVNNPEKRALIESIAQKKEEMQMAMEEYSKITSEDEMRDLIESRQRWIYDYNTGLSVAKNEGIAEGIEQGIEQGQIEERKSMILKMLSNGLRIDEVSKLTGLEQEEINELINMKK